MKDLVNLFSALSDPTRLRLLFLLSDGPKNVTTLCETLQLPQATVSHHLGLLRMARLVRGVRKGKEVHYSLDEAAVSMTDGGKAMKLKSGDGRAVRIVGAA